MTTLGTRPACSSDVDLFSERVLAEPWDAYRELRDIGRIAHLARYDLWVLTRYDEVRAALADHRTFISSKGIGLNPIINEAWAGNAITTDPPEHGPLRKVFTDALRPRFVRKLVGDLERRADDLVHHVIDLGEFDAVDDFAKVLPVDVVMDLIGWPDQGRNELVGWAEGSFNAAGPQNDRMMSSLPKLEQLFAYLNEVATPENLTEDSFGAMVYAAAERGDIDRANCIPLLAGYATAALDTTINAVSSLMRLFSVNPDQWALVHANPSLVPNAFLEGLRMESPIQFFSRVTSRDVDFDGIVVPEGTRVVHSYGAANRDERHYPDPDRFDVRRGPGDHLAFDHGTHVCAGQPLATLEAHALFRALATHVKTIEPTGEPTLVVNNMTRGPAHVPVRVTPADPS
jgi:cytochrome P450